MPMSKSFFENTIRAAILSFYWLAAVPVIAALTYLAYCFELLGFEMLFAQAFAGSSIFGFPVLAVLATTLNVSKILLSIQAMRLKGISWASVLRGALIIYTCLMMLLTTSAEIVDPNLESLVENTKVAARSAYETERQQATDDYAARLAANKNTFESEREVENTDYKNLRDPLNDLHTKEMGIGGQQFKGARYKELDAKIEELDKKHQTALHDIFIRETAAVSALQQDLASVLKELDVRLSHGVSGITADSLSGSTEAQNPAIIRLVSTIHTIIAPQWLTPKAMTFLITVLITALIELVPIALLSGALRFSLLNSKTTRAATSAESILNDNTTQHQHRVSTPAPQCNASPAE